MLRPIDDARLAAAGIRKLTGRHLVLYTDLPADPEVDRLPAVFDLAVPQWADYFGLNQPVGRSPTSTKAQVDAWQVRGFLIKDRAKFESLGLMPPPGSDHFINGISLSGQFWLYEQPTAYYRRHLMLHEGTHAFMGSLLGGCGPVWYMEGTAELLATHRLDEATGKLTLRTMPRDREEVPMLGRIELLRAARENKRLLGLPAVMQIDNRGLIENEAYAWCWSASVFLDSHPRYRERFRGLRRHVLARNFNEIARSEYEEDWPDLLNEWQAFVAALDHGFDFERMSIDFRRGDRLRNGASPPITVQADRGWQSSRVRLDAGQTYRITASGRFQIAEETISANEKSSWPSEAGGVTVEYYAGKPLGLLLGAIVPERSASTPTEPATRGASHGAETKADSASFAQPIAIGLGTTFQSPSSGTLYLRVNDSAGRLHDNRGTLAVTIEVK